MRVIETATVKQKRIQKSNRDALFTELVGILVNYDFKSVSEAADVGVTTLWNWCYGATIAPRLNTLVKVAKVLGYELALVPAEKH